MIIPASAIRRLMMLGLMLAALIALADSVAQNEVRRATSEMAFAAAAARPVGASDE
ncbi:hypothetical protein MCBMB27_05822 (plasmid) [Methylobacterium phyllosphaerae]|uniref:Uncharacterized protein n=1 Tax=Methylobacterium phyllosphaerae TaxID=418223 RepID=A0AAE8HXG2_9HYPH|nr:hypothetical protein MCBMB27_05822 [Methylobacterium phyllosphaerae]SFH62622.1 hypothetical protein SAMN05192567_13735 [Methylobacterium phyllosphaerae]